MSHIEHSHTFINTKQLLFYPVLSPRGNPVCRRKRFDHTCAATKSISSLLRDESQLFPMLSKSRTFRYTCCQRCSLQQQLLWPRTLDTPGQILIFIPNLNLNLAGFKFLDLSAVLLVLLDDLLRHWQPGLRVQDSVQHLAHLIHVLFPLGLVNIIIYKNETNIV